MHWSSAEVKLIPHWFSQFSLELDVNVTWCVFCFLLSNETRCFCFHVSAGFPTSSTRSSSSTWRCRRTSMTAGSGTWGTQLSSHGLSWWVKKHQHPVRGIFMLWMSNNLKCCICYSCIPQGILNPMQAFLNTLAFHGWTGFSVDLSLQGRRELAWDSVSTSVPNGGGHNPMVGTTLLYQSHVQEAKKGLLDNGQNNSDAISVLSEGNCFFSGSNNSPVYQGWWMSHQHGLWYMLCVEAMAGLPLFIRWDSYYDMMNLLPLSG